MNKKPVLFVAAVLAALAFSQHSSLAQVANVVEIVSADRDKIAGCEGPYRFDAAPLTPPPRVMYLFILPITGGMARVMLGIPTHIP